MASDCDAYSGFTAMTSDCDVYPGFRRIKPSSKPNNSILLETKRAMPCKLPDCVIGFVQSIADNFLSPLTEISTKLGQAGNAMANTSVVPTPVLFSNMAVSTFSWPQSSSSFPESVNNSNVARASPPARNVAAGFPSNVRIDGIDSGIKRGPAFVGQVFSMCDPSGTGLMAVSTNIQLPFVSRMPELIKKIFAWVTKNDMKGPVFRFFLDIGDAVRYVKRLNIPSGMVGACRLDVAYEHFKEKPQMFQFVPNEKQVKEANKLLRKKSRRNRSNQLKGVPVFTAQNLNIAIATKNGIRWYTPYFFDKRLLNNILEVSVDQHFQALIQNRYIQRRREMTDDDFPTEMIEEHFESLLDPPEVQDLMEEMGQAGVPLNSVISKAAEVHLNDVVDRFVLGNRLIRKITGIQPEFPFMVDSFEERTAAAVSRARKGSLGINIRPELRGEVGSGSLGEIGGDFSASGSECNLIQGDKPNKCTDDNVLDTGFPQKDRDLHFKSLQKSKMPDTIREEKSSESKHRDSVLNGEYAEQSSKDRLMPKITMVGISMSEPRRMSKAGMKKTMAELTREIEERNQRKNDFDEDKDPLFVANVGDFSDFASPSSVLEESE